MSKIEIKPGIIAYKDIWFFIDEYFTVWKLVRTGDKGYPLLINKVQKSSIDSEGRLIFDLETLYKIP